MKLKAIIFSLLLTPVLANAQESIVTLTSGMEVVIEASKQTTVICDEKEPLPRCKLDSTMGAYVVSYGSHDVVEMSYEDAIARIKELREVKLCR